MALIARLGEGTAAALPDYIRWEAELLTELGYGLDLARCALTGAVDELTLVSPRTGRAVSAEAGAPWADRLLPLPRFLLGQSSPASPADCLAGLRLTGHFLGRDAFGHQNQGLPMARGMLQDRVAASLG